MDLGQIEFAAKIVFEMCRQHPEICPHSHSWHGSSAPDENGYRDVRYVCELCGHEEIRKEKDRYWRPKEN